MEEEKQQESRVAVQSPCDLHAGFVFVAEIDSQQFRVTVPESVKEGEIFEIAIPYTATTITCCGEDENAPVLVAQQGQWKDGLFDCFRYGPLHPSLCNALCCPQLLMTQLSNRLNSDKESDTNKASDTACSHCSKKTSSSSPSSYKRATTLLLVACLVDFLLIAPCLEIMGAMGGASTSSVDGGVAAGGDSTSMLSGSSIAIQIFYVLWSLGLTMLAIWSVVQLRAAVRAKHNIPQGRSCCGLPYMEDVCCVVCCHCCTLAQLARQTADYDVETAQCCTTNGLSGTKRINLCLDL